MIENVIFCSRCGTQNPAQASFCQKCGAGLGSGFPAPAPVAPVAAYAPVTSSAGYGGFWIRFVAIVIDWIVLAFVSWPIRALLFGVMHVSRYHWGPYYDGNIGPLFAVVPVVFGANTRDLLALRGSDDEFDMAGDSWKKGLGSPRYRRSGQQDIVCASLRPAFRQVSFSTDIRHRLLHGSLHGP
jgi:zinc-ribbon domain